MVITGQPICIYNYDLKEADNQCVSNPGGPIACTNTPQTPCLDFVPRGGVVVIKK